MAAKIKKGDTVKIITGNGRGSTGKVLSIDVTKDRVVVEGANLCWKHIKPSKKSPQGGRLQIERSIHLSNVMPMAGEKCSRVKFAVDSKGNKQRVLTDGTKL